MAVLRMSGFAQAIERAVDVVLDFRVEKDTYSQILTLLYKIPQVYLC